MRSVSGLRGVVGQDLTAGIIHAHAEAFAALLPSGPLLLARDSRSHGPMLMSAAAQALRKAGRRLLLADLIPTPTAQFLVTDRRLAGALVLTASHNPSEYNGLKFIGPDGCFLDGERAAALFELADQAEIPAELPERPIRGEVMPDAVGRHILDILNLGCIDVEAIVRRRFRVVVDAVNGAASVALPALLEALGCEVIRLHTTPNGEFPRGPEPVPENLGALAAAVTAGGAKLGLATDPDADRLALVDETGRPIGEELTQVLAVDGYLRRTASREPVTTNLSSSQLLEHVAGRYGVEVLRSAVGEVNVVAMMRAAGGEIGGEGNGGVILAASHLGRDALVGAALILDRLVQEKQSLSAIVDGLPRLHLLKDKLAIDGHEIDQLYTLITQQYPDAEHNTVDGLKVQWEDRWVHIRASNTEPVIRIYAEAATAEEAHGLIAGVRAVVAKGVAGAGA